MQQVFQPLSGLADEVLRRSPPLAEWRKFVYCDSLAANAEVYGEVDHFKGGCRVERVTTRGMLRRQTLFSCLGRVDGRLRVCEIAAYFPCC